MLALFSMVMIFGFTAFAVDIGYISLTRNHMQNAADASAMAAAADLAKGWGLAPELTEAETVSLARLTAEFVAASNQMSGQTGAYIDRVRDVRFGHRQWNPASQSYDETWGVGPYNLAEVTVRRDGASGSPDGPINLFFAPVLGTREATSFAIATVAMAPGVGFRVESGSRQRAPVLPIAFDEDSWNDIRSGIGSDTYNYNVDTGHITAGSDGVIDFDIYPFGSSNFPPGNRGTVDFGSSNNSTEHLKRQILDGLNEYDLSSFGGELRFDEVPIVVNGDTGISAGLKLQLRQIIGETRALPIFSEVSGNGNNAMYTIVKFVGIRILEVKLTGGKKYLIVQSAPLSDVTVIRGEDRIIETDSILAPASFVD